MNRTKTTTKDTMKAFQMHVKAVLKQDRNVFIDFVR